MRSRIDALDDGVFLLWIKIWGKEDDTVNVVDPVTVFRDVAFGCLPTGGCEFIEAAGFGKDRHSFAVREAANFMDGRMIDARPLIHEVGGAGRKGNVMSPVSLS